MDCKNTSPGKMSGEDERDSEGRKRKSVDSPGSSTADGQQECSGRPKRRCTMGRKTVYSYDHEDIEDDLHSEQTPPLPQRRKQKGIVNFGQQKGNHGRSQVTEELKANYRWMEHNVLNGKISCKICSAAGLTKWFVTAKKDSDNLLGLLRWHEASEEHKRSSQEAHSGKQKSASLQGNSLSQIKVEQHLPPAPPVNVVTPIFRKSQPKVIYKDVFCIPMECVDPIPLPNNQLRSLLMRHGLKSKVKFSQDQTPAKLREDISKAFRQTFNLRIQELLQFDYLALSPDKMKLTKPQKMLHFDASTVLAFVGDSDVYILLKQKAPTVQNVDWEQLLSQQDRLNSLGDVEYKEVMLSVMYRLSSGKHKKDATQEQMKLVESLIHQYKLNSHHQLVYTGNQFDQLVMFVDKRRHEAFKTAHGFDHFDLQTTFNNLFGLYYWNGIEQWVTHQVRNCTGCLEKYGEDALNAQMITMDEQVDGGHWQTDEIDMTVPLMTVASLTSAPSTQLLKSTSTDDMTDSLSSDKERAVAVVKKESDVLPPEDVGNVVVSDLGDACDDGEDEDESRKSSRCAESMHAMHMMQKKGKFCDFEIVLMPTENSGDRDQPVTFNVHRVVLATLSSKIADMSATRIKVNGKVSADAVERIIEFAYTGDIAGVRAIPQADIARIGSTALALDVRIEQYLREVRTDFTGSDAKIQVVQKGGKVQTADDLNGS